jgi:hypothetical protein
MEMAPLQIIQAAADAELLLGAFGWANQLFLVAFLH